MVAPPPPPQQQGASHSGQGTAVSSSIGKNHRQDQAHLLPPSTSQPTPTGLRRAPGSFSANLASTQPLSALSRRPQLSRIDTDSSGDDSGPTSSLYIAAHRPQNVHSRSYRPASPAATASAAATGTLSSYRLPSRQQSSSELRERSSASLSNPSAPFAQRDRLPRSGSPLAPASRPSVDFLSRTHTRKHSSSQQGFFEPSLPSSSQISSKVEEVPSSTSKTITPAVVSSMAPNPNLSASQIAAQAAMQSQAQQLRRRSQTLPREASNSPVESRRPSATKGMTVLPPTLSLTEASGGSRNHSALNEQLPPQTYRNGLLGDGNQAATTAASRVFSRSPSTSPNIPSTDYMPSYREAEKLMKPEKSSINKIFSRPGKLIINKDSREKALPSPHKLGSAMAALQRNSPSSSHSPEHNLNNSSSMYSLQNSSTATIRPADVHVAEKEKKHNFLSRQKNKLSSKDSDHHLQLSSAASNSRPVNPNAPSSMYNFSLPSPGASSTSFSKSMSGLDLRHGGKALRDKKNADRATDHSRDIESSHGEWPGPSSLGSNLNATSFPGPGGATPNDAQDLSRYALNSVGSDDVWPFLKARLLGIFDGEDLRLPVEDFNSLIRTHLERCIQRRTPNLIIEDVRDLLTTGFRSLDLTLRRTPDERLIPHLVDIWLTTFTVILPFLQAVFLPLDQELSGTGVLMTADQARDFWGAVPRLESISDRSTTRSEPTTIPAGQILDVRRIVLNTYRDVIILPRYQTLTKLFSRLSLENINTNLNLDRIETLSSSPSSGRPGTAMSLDPSTASYNSQTTTLLGQPDLPFIPGARSRAISNVSFGSDRRDMTLDTSIMPPPARPFTPGSTHPLPSLYPVQTSTTTHSLSSSQREAEERALQQQQQQQQRDLNTEESGRVTETAGRMLQCMSVLSSTGDVDGAADAQQKMEELCKGLKLNWLGRGRTGRNRRGFVGGRVRGQAVVV